VFPALTVRENLTLFATGDRTAAIEKAAEAFPVLGSRVNQRAGSLSGGEQQMLALARAYLTDARLILLDEVSMGLAPKIVDEIFSFIAQLAASGVALLLVEQYVSKALELADFVYVMQKGGMVLEGKVADLDHDEIHARYLG
jgi:branched-chain amino acid transport system ATP-binding protein